MNTGELIKHRDSEFRRKCLSAMVELRKQGWQMQEIAKLFGYKDSSQIKQQITIYEHLKEKGEI